MITTGKTIYTILSTDTAVTALVGSKIYPIIIPENTKLPCIVYERAFDCSYTKDYRTGSASSINITVIADKYIDTIAICNAVDAALSEYRDEHTRSIRLTGGEETYAEGAYLQNLSYMVLTV